MCESTLSNSSVPRTESKEIKMLCIQLHTKDAVPILLILEENKENKWEVVLKDMIKESQRVNKLMLNRKFKIYIYIYCQCDNFNLF